MWRLKRESTILAVIDVQEKLAKHMTDSESLQTNIDRLVRGCHLLNVPALLTEQYPKGLGDTTRMVQKSFDETYGAHTIQKLCFSGVGCADFSESLKLAARKQVVLAGIEAHVCVYQTAMDLLESGYQVHLVSDAISSRSAANKDIALRRLVSEGAKISSTEMVLFELTIEAGTDEFRAISKLVK
ncbi:MAG TPA: hydrolase [Thermoanaerobaculia bacterium]|nr:hydrolase [Thermoanaerobaculia bacterium]